MSRIQDLTNVVRDVVGAKKSLREEDDLRSLAVKAGKGYRLPIVYSNNEYVLTRSSAWVAGGVPPKPWGFLSLDARKQYHRAASGVFNNIFPSGKGNAGHLIVTNNIVSADEQADLLVKRHPKALEAFPHYVTMSKETIDQSEFFERETYLLTKIGMRGNHDGWKGYVRSFLESIGLGAGWDDSFPAFDEQMFWADEAQGVKNALDASWLDVKPMAKETTAWLTSHLETRCLPTPLTIPAHDQEWGTGFWRSVLASSTQVVELGMYKQQRFRCVEINAPTGTAYAAFLPLRFIPTKAAYDLNWLHHSASLPFPVDASVHFEVIDPDRAERDFDKPSTDAAVQEEEDRDAGVRPDEGNELAQEELRTLKTRIQRERVPVSYWQATFAVSDTSKKNLLEKVGQLIEHYNGVNMVLECPPHDQRELYYQAFPGSDMLVEEWIHRSQVDYLAQSQPWLTAVIGDTTQPALYQGFTRDARYPLDSADGLGQPMFFDLHNLVKHPRGAKSPTEIIAAAPGGGKTVSRGLKAALEDALMGRTQFVWDPKGDFLALASWAPELQLDPAKVKVVNLHDPNQSVSLDAYALAEVSPEEGIDDRRSSAVEVLTALCREHLRGADESTARAVIYEAVEQTLRASEVAGTPPTMRTTLSFIDRWRQNDFEGVEHLSDEAQRAWQMCARTLFSHLNVQSSSALGRLFFSDPNESGSLKVDEGDIVIFVAMNMQTTEPGDEPTAKTLLGDVVSGLMCDYIRSLLYTLPDAVPKTLTFDEWHVIRRSDRANRLVDWLRRMGRSKTCAVRQMSQSAADFDAAAVVAVWCGRIESEDEARASCRLLGLEEDEFYLHLFLRLRNGQFVFRDADGRIALVEVDLQDDQLYDFFNTQAEEKQHVLAELAKRRASTSPDADSTTTASLVG